MYVCNVYIDLYVDDHYIITGHINGIIMLWQRQTGQLLRGFDANKKEWGSDPSEPAAPYRRRIESDTTPLLAMRQTGTNLTTASQLQKRINKIRRWGDWIFCGTADCFFNVWGKSLALALVTFYPYIYIYHHHDRLTKYAILISYYSPFLYH